MSNVAQVLADWPVIGMLLMTITNFIAAIIMLIMMILRLLG